MRAIATIAFGFAVLASTECRSETALWKAFAAKTNVMRWVGRESLVLNPYKYKDRVVAFQAWYVGSISETAIFSDRSGNLNQTLSVQSMSSKSLKKGDAVVIAVQVSGPDTGHQSENLALVELYHCRKMACSEFANFNNSGELMLTERPKPLRLMIQGGGSAGKQIVGEKRED
jgi:hypothetical protein